MKYINCILFLFLLFINYSLSTIILSDVSPINTPYSKYSSVTDGKCSFSFFILNANDDGTNTGTDVLQPTTSSSITKLLSVYSTNSTSKVYNVTFNSVSTSTTTYSETLISGSTSIILNFGCYAIDISQINIELINNNIYQLYSVNKIGYIKINGLDTNNIRLDKSSLSISCSSPYICSSSQVQHTNYFSLNFGSSSETDDYSKPLIVTISVYNGISNSWTVKDYPYGLVNEDIMEFSVYPPSDFSSKVEFNNPNMRVLYTFTSNTTSPDQKSSLYKTSITYSQNMGSIAIKSNETTTTYIGFIDTSTITNTPVTFTLYSLENYLFKQRYQTTYSIAKSFPSASGSSTFSFTSLNPEDIGYLATVQFTSTNYDVTPLTQRLLGLYTVSNNAPYGFSSGNNAAYTYRISVPLSQFNNDSGNHLLQVSYYSSIASLTIPTSSLVGSRPVVINYELIHLDGIDFIARFKIESSNGVKDLNQYLVSGTIYNGVYEMITNPFSQGSTNYYRILDHANMVTVYYLDNIITMNPVTFYSTERFYDNNNNFDVFDIKDVSFLYNDIDVTNQTIYNTMYFNYSSNVPRSTPFVLYLYGEGIARSANIFSISPLSNSFTAFWNETAQLFQIDFIVPQNSQPSNSYPYYLIVNRVYQLSSYSLPLSCQLRVKSLTLDLYGPIFNNIIKSTNIIINENQIEKVGWKIEIKDEINGLDYGYIVVRGSIDNSVYNFTIDPSKTMVSGGNKFIGEYEIYVNVSSPCVSQELIITDVLLKDIGGGSVSSFSLTGSQSANLQYTTLTPFINYLNDPSINRVSFTCPTLSMVDSTPPEIVSFSVSRSQIDVGSIDRTVSVIIQARDIDSGLKSDQSPFIYFSDSALNVISCPTIELSRDSTSASYNCTITIPVGFGYPYGLYISAYGLINQYGLYKGYSVDQLKSAGYQYFISTNSTFDVTQPIILRNKRITTKDTTLWLYGKGFDNVDQVQVLYHQDNSDLQILEINRLYSSALSVTLLKKTYNQFYITLITKDSRKSNQFLISPIYYPIPGIQFNNNNNNDSSSSNSGSGSNNNNNSNEITQTPITTNAPQTCKGTPVCGGSKRGICTSNGCICISPYIGLDCSSKTIETLQPSFNNTNPNIELPTIEIDQNNNNSSSGGTNQIKFKSLISIVALRELNIENKEINYYALKNWMYNEINSSVSEYFGEIKTGDGSTTTCIKVTIQWFNKSTTINFADSELIMNPSTIKYTIELSSYPFSTKLNSLQLIMSAKLESTDTNSCSSKEFGETSTGDNSNYLKVQVDDHSIYSRFIKRGILDSNTRTITNQLLDNSFKVLSNSYQSESYIGINIQYYNKNAIIDPDFSVIIDSYSASSKSNSICSNKSKLSPGKIAGIVLGSIGFASVIIISVVYHYRKNKKDSRFKKSINDKVRAMN